MVGHTNISFKEESTRGGHQYKSLLHHIYKHNPVQRRILSLKNTKEIPKTLNQKQYQQLLSSCNNARDMFLVSLLQETGLRIGQALALRHDDIITWDNEIHVQQRLCHLNEAYNKTPHPYIVHVSPQLMAHYNSYIAELNDKHHSDYVFVDEVKHAPLHYNAVYKLFSRLSKKIGLHVTPHMLRHTHATELIQLGWDASFVQKRLGHANVQTTIDVYAHIDQQSLKSAYQKYLADKDKNNEII